MAGSLYLIPTTIGDTPIESAVPPQVIDILGKIRFFIVEDVRTARRYMAKAGKTEIINQSTFFVLNKHSQQKEIQDFLKPAIDGSDIGLLSESGLPCVADPGNVIVEMAHKKNIRVIPLPGPSSIMLALMASGLNGQNFAFNGYLPIDEAEKRKKILELEKRSSSLNQSQIFFETPFRNNNLLKEVLCNCRENTMLCVASQIMLPDEFIKTLSIAEWKYNIPDLHKKMCIYIMQAKK